MLTLKLIDKTLSIRLKWWEKPFWPINPFDIPLDDIENTTVENKRPYSILCTKRPIANLPPFICIGLFYPDISFKKSQLWCYTLKHKVFLNIDFCHLNYDRIVLGLTPRQADIWFNKIKPSIIKNA
jgi:hypothetical protein